MKKLLIATLIIMLFTALFMTNTAFVVFAEEENNVALAEISYNYLLYSSGRVFVNIQVWVNYDYMSENLDDEEKDDLKTSINMSYEGMKSLFTHNGYQTEIKNGYLEVVLGSYDSLTDMYVKTGRNGYEKDSGGSDFKMGVFFNTYTTVTKTPLSNLGENSLIFAARDMLTMIEGIEKQNIDYIYNYGTKYNKNFINSDSDKYYALDGVNIHSFIMSEDDLNREITLVQTTPNTLTWYGIVIIVCAAFVVAIVLFIRKKRAKNGGN